MNVKIQPLPPHFRRIPARLRPMHPPIFEGSGEPTADDHKLARELWRALDSESRRWYLAGSPAGTFAGLPLDAGDLAALRDDCD